jgi:bla regulator protein blaR1
MTTLRNKLALISLSLSLICALTFATGAQTKSSSKSERTSGNQEDNTWNWHHNDNAVDLRVTIRGKVEFADDYSDVKSISDGGNIRVKDDRGGTVRKFEASEDRGSIKRSYSINGQASAFDDDARRWLAKILDQTVRLGGYDAKARVQKLLKQSGPRGVLAEIPQLKTDYVKRIYFNELFAQGQLDADSARQALRLAGTQLSSDYEKAQLLVKMSDTYLTSDEMRGIYIEAVNTIQSDYERGRALSALLKKGELSKSGLLFAIKSAGNIKSDYERAQLLIRIANAYDLDQTAQTAYVDAITSIDSDYEKGRVLSALLKKAPGKETLLFALKSASTISSDYEKAQLPLRVARSSSTDETVRNALIEAARTIGSEYERGRVLSAVFK